MKKLCYLILAHNNLDYVADLIESLSSDNVGFIVHIDSKCSESLKPVEEISNRRNVKLMEDRKDILWGGKSMVDIVNQMSRLALDDNMKYDYFILLSGQDMPVKSSEYILNYLETNGYKNYLAAGRMMTAECVWQEQGRRRLECYAVRLGQREISTIEPGCLNYNNLRQIFKTFLYGDRASILSMVKALFSARRSGLGIVPYGGEFWWRMNRKSLKTIIDYYDSHPELDKELSYTSNPDEIVYNTLAYNLCDNIENDLLTYVKWGG